jgi:hypothetical protein
VAVTNGSGDSKAPDRANAIAKLGYPTLLVLDGDVTTNAPRVQAAIEAGAEVIQWSTGKALEDVVVESLSLEGLQQLVDLAADETSEEGVRAQVASRLNVSTLTTTTIADWVVSHGEENVRSAVAAAAKGQKANGLKTEDKSWFKREDRGERLASLVLNNWVDVKNKELGRGLENVRSFAYRLALRGPMPTEVASLHEERLQ